MTWLVPSALAIAGAASLVAVALHFIARRRPLAEPLPTARFIPAQPVQARTRAFAASDLSLLAVRIAALLAIGLAVAAPRLGGGGRVTRIVLLDRSRAVANAGEARDSLRMLGPEPAVVIPFDSAATANVSAGVLDALTITGARGSLSAALARALRVAARLSPSTDSIDLVLVSPLAGEEIDAATTRIRAAWPGRIRVIPVRAAPAADSGTGVTVRAPDDDAVAAGLALMGVVHTDAPVRLVRGEPTSADTAWASRDGHVLVHWPATAADARWTARTPADEIGGVISGGGVLVARFPRPWTLAGPSVARWSDGEPAAVEHSTGTGCIRDVGILIDESSDVALGGAFRDFVRGLLHPCGGARSVTPLAAGDIATIAGAGHLAAATALRDPDDVASPWTPWLFALAALLLIAELALRRATRRAL